MTKDEIRNDILGINSNCILAELPTSTGKSRVALDFMHERQVKTDILIVIPRKVLKKNWEDEFIKWGYKDNFKQVTFTTYISLPKYVNKKFGLIIFDECHHLSERARACVDDLIADYYILLSATVPKTLKRELKFLFPGLQCYKISMRDAIENEILPDPKVFLFPLELDNTRNSETLIINPSAKGAVRECSFKDRFRAKKDKANKYKILCSQAEFHEELSSMIEFYKRRYFLTNNKMIYFRWQQKSKERLNWLAGLKNGKVHEILYALRNRRTLTFCNGIEQTKILGEYCINSENKKSEEYLEAFNSGEINHITACNMINEGINLVNCQVGIFVSINSSDIMIKQKNGRILRHSDPIIIILYYKHTREEEIVNEIVGNYNPELITVVTNLEQLNGK